MEEEYKSRSQKKRESTALQERAKKLLYLKETALMALDLDEDLLLALKDYKQLKSHEAKRRQMQYIGRLMRRVQDLSFLPDSDLKV